MADEADLRRQLAALEQDIVEITAELAAAKRESARVALAQELAEKEQARAALAEQLAITFGSGNTFAQANVAAATQGTVTQTSVSGRVNIPGAQVGDHATIAGGNITIYGPEADTRPLDDLRTTYLAHLSATLRQLRLPEDPDTADTTQRRVSIDDLYTRLEVGRRKPAPIDDASLLQQLLQPEDPAPRRARGDRPPRFNPFDDDASMPAAMVEANQPPLSVLEAAASTRRLVVLGAPGSGKTTFVTFLVYSMCEALLGDAHAAALLQAEGWPALPPLPILVRLNDWAAWWGEQQPAQDDALWTYLQRDHPAKLVQALQTWTLAGQTLLIFDGLDEVPLTPVLDAVKATVETLARIPAARVLVTCRVLDYRVAARQLGDRWQIDELQPFSLDGCLEFVRRWYATLASLARQLFADPDELRKSLQLAIRMRHDLRRLAGNPLLLTMMALLHSNKGRLPEDRVQLYSECIDLLLLRWRRKAGDPSLEEELQIPRWQHSNTKRLLNHLAYAAHRQIDPESNTKEESFGGTNLSEKLLREVAFDVFAAFPHLPKDMDPSAPVVRFLHYIERKDNGVLQVYEKGRLRFPHRTFQEYLAAQHLLDDASWPLQDGGRVERLQAHAGAAAWHEVLLLAASQLIVNNYIDDVAALLRRLLEERRKSAAWARKAILAGEMLVELQRKGLALRPQDQKLHDETVKRLQYTLSPTRGSKVLTFVDAKIRSLTVLDVRGRIEAGMVLGLLHNSSLRGQSPIPEWGDVAAGTFLMGSDPARDKHANTGEHPQHPVTLPAYRIARYPITNGLYGHFINAGGYTDERWWSWSGDALEWWRQLRRGEPTLWDHERYNNPLQPVVGVTWYEAVAYTRWLEHAMQAQGQLGSDETVRLPTEAEWEYAARGADGRRYPWGDEWRPDHANTRESGIGVPTPVGCFPAGASPWGALDMAGNVWEWCANGDYSYADRSPPLGWEGAEIRMLRGGSYSGDSTNVRCAARDGSPPGLYYNLGFRCVVAPRSL